MKMKNLIYIVVLGLFIYSCSATKDRDFAKKEIMANANDTVRIANDSLEYEIIVIEPGFNLFINSIAKPRGYYSQSSLENKNNLILLNFIDTSAHRLSSFCIHVVSVFN